MDLAIIEKCTTEKQVRNALERAGVPYTYSDGSFYICKTNAGYTRIFRPYKAKNYTLQVWERVRFEYSGIPTFCPSGKWSNY